MVRLDGKSVIVIGGASGLGKTICEVLGRAGASLVLVDKDELKARQTNKDLSSEGIKCNFLKADVTKAEEVQAMIDQVLMECGKIDVLVNCAGGISQGFITEISDNEWDEMINTHLKGVFLTCRSVLPYMLEKGKGKIVNIASMEAKQGHPFAGVHYSAAKGGVIAFTRQLALQVSPLGIHVNCVAPGVLEDTALTLTLTNEGDFMESRTEVPLGRLTKPTDVAYAVLFLASPMAEFLTGETIDVNGGKYLT